MMIIRFTFDDDDRCPGCQITWGLFLPARIHGQRSTYRCVECKRLYRIEPVEIAETITR